MEDLLDNIPGFVLIKIPLMKRGRMTKRQCRNRAFLLKMCKSNEMEKEVRNGRKK